MKIDRGNIIPARYLLMGFTGELVLPVGSIKLQVLVCDWPHSDWTKSLVCRDAV
jgi:hypothetical protein